MTRQERMRPRTVEVMPETLEDGIVYIAPQYRIALHRCCCGCGMEVATPIGPTEFSVTVTGDRVSIRPSIGNHDFPCQSHYFITDGRVRWSYAMSRAEIEAGRARDRRLRRGRKTWRQRVVAGLAWLAQLLRK